MTKEGQIEEMAQDIFHAGVALDGVDFAYGLFDDDDHFRRLARKLRESGYRKADEVRKETAREVISWILNHIDVYAYFDQIMNFFAEKYDNDGVKVVEDERK